MNREYTKYLQSKEWLEIRLDILTTRKVCEKCGSKKKLQVHHKHYKNIFKEEPEDLELLCDKCHVNEHKHKLNPKKQKKQKRSLAQKLRDKQRRKKANARKLYKHYKF